MLDFLLEIIALVIFSFPGAFIRWLIFKPFNREKSFKEYMGDDIMINGFVGMSVFAMIIIWYHA